MHTNRGIPANELQHQLISPFYIKTERATQWHDAAATTVTKKGKSHMMTDPLKRKQRFPQVKLTNQTTRQTPILLMVVEKNSK